MLLNITIAAHPIAAAVTEIMTVGQWFRRNALTPILLLVLRMPCTAHPEGCFYILTDCLLERITYQLRRVPSAFVLGMAARSMEQATGFKPRVSIAASEFGLGKVGHSAMSAAMSDLAESGRTSHFVK